MCLDCHTSLSDEKIKNDLNTAGHFSVFNSTSISHIIIASTGYNGNDVRNIGINLLSNYNKFLLKSLINNYQID